LRVNIEVQETEEIDHYPVWFIWQDKKYYVDSTKMSSYWHGSGYPVAITVKGKKHTLWLDGDDWYVEVRK
jgi:hypothetical protein